jgi:hypothetical protein
MEGFFGSRRTFVVRPDFQTGDFSSVRGPAATSVVLPVGKAVYRPAEPVSIFFARTILKLKRC